MQDQESIQLIFRGLADPTRRQILLMLVQQEMSIGAICSCFTMTRAAVKKHLSVLEEGGLVSVHKQGREQINRFEPVALALATDWLRELDTFWEHRLINLKETIEKGTQP